MLAESKSLNYTDVLSTATGLGAVTKWLPRLGILGHFKIARDMALEHDARYRDQQAVNGIWKF
jgi:hypothetical protein